MPTGDRVIEIYEKRLLERTALEDNFKDFLIDMVNEVAAAIFQGASGVLDDDEIEITSSSNDTFTLDITDASKCLVGGGQIVDLAGLASSLYTSVAFENNTGSTYSVGIRYMEIPDGIELNPRKGDPEYPKLKQTYGEVAHPNSVTDNTTYIRIVIDSITDGGDGEEHDGRTVRVWLADPVSGVESIAYYQGTSGWNGTDGNYIDIPYTSPDGPLGQDTGIDPPSTTAADYWVAIEGPSWRDKANKDLSADSNYAFIGEITGNGPTATPVAFNVAGQNPIFIHSLDRAYDGATGGGNGRTIDVDSEAVEMLSRAGSADELYATLRVDRKGGTEDGGIGIQAIADQSDGREACSMDLMPMVHSTGNMIVDNPCTTTNPNIVTRTGSVNWVTSNVQPGADFAWLQGFTTSDGLYAITAVAATTLTLANIDGGALSLTGSESGNVTILRPIRAAGAFQYGNVALTTVAARGLNSFSGLNEDGAGATAAVNLFGWESDCLKAWDTETNPLNLTERSSITNRGVHDTHGIIVRPNPFVFTGAADELVHAIIQPTDDPPDDVSSARLAMVKGVRGQEIERLEYLGRWAKTHRFKDDFNYRSTYLAWSTPGPYYDTAGSGSTPGFTTGVITDEGGWATLSTDSTSPAIGQSAQVRGEFTFRIAVSGPTNRGVICLFAKIRLDDVAHDPEFRIGFRDSGGSDTIWWESIVGGGATPWTLKSDNGSGGTSSESSGVSPSANADVKLWIVADPFASSGNGIITGRVEQGGSKVQLAGQTMPTKAGRFLNLLGIFAYVETNDADVSAVHIDEWEAWDDINLRSGDAE